MNMLYVVVTGTKASFADDSDTTTVAQRNDNNRGFVLLEWIGIPARLPVCWLRINWVVRNIWPANWLPGNFVADSRVGDGCCRGAGNIDFGIL